MPPVTTAKNLVLYSENFDHGIWLKQAATVTRLPSPKNIYKVTTSKVENFHILGQNVSPLQRASYIASVAVKSGEKQRAYIEIVADGVYYAACFSLVDGSYTGRYVGADGSEPAGKGSIDLRSRMVAYMDSVYTVRSASVSSAFGMQTEISQLVLLVTDALE